MARVVAAKENGVWTVLIDVDQYGGDKMTPARALGFAADIKYAAEDAKNNNRRDSDRER